MGVRLLTSGGLGDAIMAIGKIYSKNAPFPPNNISIHHVRIRDELSKEIRELYKLQNIKADVFCIPNWAWQKENRHLYDYFLGSGWSKDNFGGENSWEINPFPPLKYKHKKGIKTIVNPISGRNRNRKFSIDDLRRFVEGKDITIIGKTNDKDYIRAIESLPVKNLINKTNLEEVINIICSASTVISPEGFIPYLAAMANKEVFISQNVKAIRKRKHPKWKMRIVEKLRDI